MQCECNERESHRTTFGIPTKLTASRFQDWKSEKTSEGNFHAKDGVHQSKVAIASNELHKGLKPDKWRAKSIIQIVISRLSGFMEESLGSNKNILDPQGPFLQKCNKIFILSCVIAISLDPLFLYIPVIDNDNKCLGFDRPLEVTASVFRSFNE
ncbi:hypothetical protein CQW23_14263 [Capsicum baccatum]|uniref:Uncharacterized protein n=1 Tax=Capsicum baccatum TaxID=33114 RepID=A0A2G2WIN2_CAPBA|nr:hypothetical protein CQW23_14263 [Capsicum baccatum]